MPILKTRQLKIRDAKSLDQDHTAAGRSRILLEHRSLSACWSRIFPESIACSRASERNVGCMSNVPVSGDLEAVGQEVKTSGPVHPPLPVCCPEHFTLLVKRFQLTSDSHIYH